MKKIKFLSCLFVCLFVLFLMGWTANAQTVQIGSGTTTVSNVPIDGFAGYSYTQQIYSQPQINTVGGISKIRFHFSSGVSLPNSAAWTVFMGHTTKSSFSTTTDWVPVAAMTQVFSGFVTFPAAGNWLEITFPTPFIYNNTDNLVIAVDENGGGQGSIEWRSFASGTNTGIYCGNSVVNPSPE